MTTILHVEDDQYLAAGVRAAFESFGFQGRFLIAATLQEAERILTQPQQQLDLVMSDVELPDGTGLDVVRLMRSNPAQRHVPILILSGRADAGTVSRAYALGANCYVAKTTRGRKTPQIVRTIYNHWLQDARLPEVLGSGRTHNVIALATSIRSRVAQQYMKIAEEHGIDGGDFWLSVAQREGNLANLLSFLLGQVGELELPGDDLDEFETHQKETLRVLDELREKPPITEDDAFRYLLALIAPTDTTAFMRTVGLLFPASPLAVAALLDAQAASLLAISAQIEARTSNPALRQAASQLRERASLLVVPRIAP